MATALFVPSGVTGSAPANWTERLAASSFTTEVRPSPYEDAIRWVMASGFAWHIATWDTPGTINLADGTFEVYARGYSAVDSTQQMCLQLLGPSTDNGFQGYTIGMAGGGAMLFVQRGTNSIAAGAGSVTGPTYTFSATPTGTRFPGGTGDARWVRLVRFQIDHTNGPSSGVRIQVKQWHEGQAEPGAWLIDFIDTNSARRTSGLVGVYGAYVHDDYLHYYAVGTAGDSAPRSAGPSLLALTAAISQSTTTEFALTTPGYLALAADFEQDSSLEFVATLTDASLQLVAAISQVAELQVDLEFDVGVFYEDFTGLVRDSDVALHTDYQHVFLSYYGGPEATWNARRATGARGAAVLEGYASSNLSTGHGVFQNGISALLLNRFPSIGIRHAVVVLRSSIKAVPGEILLSHFGGLLVAWSGSNLANGSGYVVLVGQNELRLGLVGQGSGTNQFIQSLGAVAVLSEEIEDLEWIRLEVTMDRFLLSDIPFQQDDGSVELFDIPTLSFGIAVRRLSDNALLGSLSYSASPIDNPAFDYLYEGEYLPSEGRIGLLYDHHEGYTQFDYVQVSSDVTAVAVELATPELLSPTPLQNITGSFSVVFRQPDQYTGTLWTRAERFNPGTGLWEVLLAPTELVGGDLPPYGAGVRSFPVSAVTWQQGREWDLRIATSLNGVEWTDWVQCGRLIVDRTGETQWTSFEEYPEANANPTGWISLWNAGAALFYPRHGLPGGVEDGIALVHKGAGSWGTGLGWLTAGYRRRRQVYGLFRLHTVQSELGVAISAAPTESPLFAGPGFYFFLSFTEAVLALRSAYNVVASSVFRVVLGAPYVVVGEVEYVGAVPTVRGKVWRLGVDDEPDWQLETTLPALDFQGLGGIVATATGYAAGERQREILNFGVTGLDPLPDDLLYPVGVLQAAVAPCTKLVTFSWTTSGYRFDEIEDLRIERRSGAGSWIAAVSGIDVEGTSVWNAANLVAGQYEARLVGELDGMEVELALSGAFVLVSNSPPLRPSIDFVQEREASIYVEASPFDDPDVSVGDYHLASEWELFDRATNALLSSSGRQSQRLTEYEFLLAPPVNGYLVVVRYWDRCGLSAVGRLTSGGTLWNCGSFECPPVGELPTSSLWTCASGEESPPPEEPPVEPEPPITPEPPPVMSLTVTPVSASIEVGQTVQLTAVARDAGGFVLVGRLVTWASLNTSVAAVSLNGLVTGVATGLVKVFAFCEGVPASSSITVFVPAPPPVEPNQPPTALFSVEEVL